MSGTNCNNIVDTAVEATSSTNNHHQPSSSSSSSTFLASENLCGQTLLSLVGKGHSILANIRILSERVPCAFLAAASLDNKRENNGGNGKRGSSAARSSSTSSDGLFLNIFGQSSSTADQSRSKDDNQLNDDGTATSSSNRNDMEEAKKYVPFLFDFSYLHNPEEWEQSLTLPTKTSTTTPSGDTNDSNEPDNLLELEREFAINHRASILEYYELFYSIYNYQKELNTFIHDLTQGYYIQYTVESVLLDVDGRALLCESVWLYGVILMLMERLLPVSVHGANVVLFDFSEYAFSNLTYLTMF